MKYSKLLVVVGLLLAALGLSSCKRISPETKSGTSAAKVESVKGTKLSRVTLSAKAAERLNIQTAPVKDAGQRKIIPYSAVIYGADGDTWTYTKVESLVFIRQPIKVDSIQKDRAILSSGPQVETQVVTVGAAELFGIEFGIGK